MTGYTVHTGANKKFVGGWDNIFSKAPQAGGESQPVTLDSAGVSLTPASGPRADGPTVHTGANKKFVSAWDELFSREQSTTRAKKSAKKSTAAGTKAAGKKSPTATKAPTKKATAKKTAAKSAVAKSVTAGKSTSQKKVSQPTTSKAKKSTAKR